MSHDFASSKCRVPSQLRNWIPALVVAVTFLTFLPVLKNTFVEWDNSTLVNNSSYRGIGGSSCSGWPRALNRVHTNRSSG